MFNLDVSISPTKNRAAVGGSLENFILDRNFQSRSKSRIFLIFGPSGRYYCSDPVVSGQVFFQSEVFGEVSVLEGGSSRRSFWRSLRRSFS